MSWSKIIAFVLFGLLQISCTEPPPPGRYDGALAVAKQYMNFDKLNDGQQILFYSKNLGCEGCRKLVERNFDSLLLIPNVYIITNSKKISRQNTNVIFDSLALLNQTDMGFAGPTILEKKGKELVYVLEVGAENRDSLMLFIQAAKKP